MCKRKRKTFEPFKYTTIDGIPFNPAPKFDINEMYARVYEELGLQQSKRDQLITIYLAAFAFIVPALLSAKTVDWVFKGVVFAGLGLIGFLFALIIVRYRKYKEVYWICCRTLNVMMSINEENWTKENIQKIFYACMHKKIKKYVVEEKEKKRKKQQKENKEPKKYKFKTFDFVKYNFFSGETLYLVIHAILSGAVLGLGVGLILPYKQNIKLLFGIIAGVIVFILTLIVYFVTLKNVYRVCVDGDNESFNYAFGDAWLLHFFV